MSDEPKFRKPNQPLTPEEIQRIDRALETTKGHRAAAAELLEMPEQRVYDGVRDNPYLRAKWIGDVPPPPDDATDLHRDPVSPFDEKVAAALDKQDALVARSRGKLPGFKPEEQDLMLRVMKTYAGQYKLAADLSHSGAVHANARLLMLIEKLNDRLADIVENPGKYDRVMETKGGVTVTKSSADYYKETADQIIKAADALRKMAETVNRGTETRMKIEKMKQEAKSGKVKKVAGWDAPGQTIDADEQKE